MLMLWICKYFIFISMTSKVIEGHKSLSNFSVNPTLLLLDGPLMLPSPNYMDLSLYLSFSLTLHLVFSSPLFLLLSLHIPLYHPLLLNANITHEVYDLKGHMRLLLCNVFLKNLRSFDQITTWTYVLMVNFCPCSFAI